MTVYAPYCVYIESTNGDEWDTPSPFVAYDSLQYVDGISIAPVIYDGNHPQYLPPVNALYGPVGGTDSSYWSSFTHMSLQLMPITPNNSTAVLITL